VQIRNLSARGSRNLPSVVTCPQRLAIYPSIKSLSAATTNNKQAKKQAIFVAEERSIKMGMIMAIRRSVIFVARFKFFAAFKKAQEKSFFGFSMENSLSP
jgi:hypothetical protein